MEEHTHHEAKPSKAEDKGILNNFTPAQTFLVGAVGGVLVLCTIGFFILLSVVLGGSGIVLSGDSAGDTNTVVVNQPTEAAVAGVKVRAVDEKRDHILGSKNAKVTIIEYSDFECPFCKRFHVTMNQVIDTYGDDVRWVYRQFPLDSLHRKARTEALATECAGEQGKFWELADLIFERTPSNDGLDLDKLPEYAGELGLNVSKFTSCLESQKYADKVQADVDDAVAAGGRGTPYSVIIGPNGESVPLSGAQPFAAVEAAIQQFL